MSFTFLNFLTAAIRAKAVTFRAGIAKALRRKDPLPKILRRRQSKKFKRGEAELRRKTPLLRNSALKIIKEDCLRRGVFKKESFASLRLRAESPLSPVGA